MSARLVGWIAAALAVAVALELAVPRLVFLAVPIIVVAKFLIGQHGKRDVAEMLVTWVAALPADRSQSDDDQIDGDQSDDNTLDWGAAVRAELASISDPGERRRFAFGVTSAMLGTPRRRTSGLLAVSVAVAFAAVLLAFSRATVGTEGVGTVTVLVPPVLLFVLSFLCARYNGSLGFAIETGILTAVTTLVAMAVVLGVEAAHWFDVAHVSVFDGDYLALRSSRAAVLDVLHPVVILVHLLFWLPWPMLGARAGIRARQAHAG
jgi:hypothetical protein